MAERITFFVSSSLSELPEERAAVQRAVESLGFDAYVHESAAPAVARPAREQWEYALAESDVVILILYRKLGEYVRGEVEFARSRRMPILAYRKVDPDGVLDQRHADYVAELEDVESGISVRYFTEAAELEFLVGDDIQQLLAPTLERGPHGMRIEESRIGVSRRSTDALRRVPLHEQPFLDRTDELAELCESIDDGEPLIAITGPYGIGKKTLARRLAREDFDGRFPDGVGVSPYHGDTTSIEDTLQALWETFHEVDDAATAVYVVDPRRRSSDLQRLEALIIIEDTVLDEKELQQIADAMPDSTFVVTTNEAWHGWAIEIGGFADPEDMLTLFETRSRISVPAATKPKLVQLFVRLGGSPYLIEALAAKARKALRRSPDATSFAAWANEIGGTIVEASRNALVPDDARTAVATLTDATVPVPPELLHAVGDLDTAIGALDEPVEPA